MRGIVRLGALFLCLASLGVTPIAMAAGDRDPVAAESLFRDGRRAADAGDWAVARERFAESMRLDPAVGTLFNLALAEEHVGLVASAWQHYRETIEQLGPSDERLPFAKEQMAALEPRLPRLTLTAAPRAPANMTVLRDGIPMTRAGFDVPVPVNPGAHVVVIQTPGHEDRRIELTVAEGDSETLVLYPGDPKAAAPSPARKPQRKPGRALGATPTRGTAPIPVTAWIAGGVGVAGIAVGAVTGIVTISKKRTFEAHCNAAYECDRTGYDAAQSGRDFAAVSTIAFAAGAVALGVAGAIIVFRPGESISVGGRF